MLMTELAMMDPGPEGNSFFSRCLRTMSQFFGFGDPPSRGLAQERAAFWHGAADNDDTEPLLHIVATTDATALTSASAHRWRRHAQLLDRPMSPLPDGEHSARQHAVKGLYAARNGNLSSAEHHFTIAAGYPDIDLCSVPGFWQLSRSAMTTAVRAYEEAGRLREASALNARIRTVYRPRRISPVPTNVTELPTRRVGLSSNS